MLDMLEFLRDEGVSADITAEIEKFRDAYPEEDETLRRRVPDPRYLYYGKDIWEEAITAILCGENLLLVGPKATGKNVLAENLATVFGRPSWNVSFYINTDAATLLGTDTFENGAVQLRKGPIYQCAETGGFGVLDEINMAKNESLAVLHATLDFRRSIDMPGYERIPLHDATRFIATYECDASQGYKDAILRARGEDVRIIHSPVGMPGRAIDNAFIEAAREGKKKPFKCTYHCVKTCDPEKSPYCIALALVSAMRGNLRTGFAFCGSNAYRINKITTVHELIEELRKEYEESAPKE